MNFKTLACTVHKIWHASKSVTHGQPKRNMPPQFLRSWGQKKQTVLVLFDCLWLLLLDSSLHSEDRNKILAHYDTKTVFYLQ